MKHVCTCIIVLCNCTILLCGCTITDRYVLDADTARRAQVLQSTRDEPVPATRQGKPVLVRSSALDFRDARASGNSVEVKARARSPMMTAGSTLTWIGTAISVAGTVLFFAYGDFDKHWAGAGLALSAEAVMWTGTALWIVAAGKHPQEVSAR
jgi:hypothetical protein